MISKLTLNFLKDLKKNNNRDWFKKHQPEYRDTRWEFMEFVQDIAHAIAKFDTRIAKVLDQKNTVRFFRLYRDVRFSKNKDPYKLNYGASIGSEGMGLGNPGYYIHIQPGGKSFVAGGLYMPPPKTLAAIRKTIAKNDTKMRNILKAAAFKKHFGGSFDEFDMLKTAPRDYPKDHPVIDLLRNKHFIVSEAFTDKEVLQKDFHKKTVAAFKAMEPLNTYLSRIVDK